MSIIRSKRFSALSSDVFAAVYDQGDGELDIVTVPVKDGEDMMKLVLAKLNRGMSGPDSVKESDIKHHRTFKAGTQDYEIEDWFNKFNGEGRRFSDEDACYVIGIFRKADNWKDILIQPIECKGSPLDIFKNLECPEGYELCDTNGKWRSERGMRKVFEGSSDGWFMRELFGPNWRKDVENVTRHQRLLKC